MAKAFANREKAIKFIKENKKHMTCNQVAKLAAKKFGYSESTMRAWASEMKFDTKNLSLREQLEGIEKKKEIKITRDYKLMLLDRPKIFIDDSKLWR